MMEHETLNLPSPKDDLEEGELSDSDSDGYTPLARPELAKHEFASVSVSLPRQMDIVSDEHDDDELHQEKSDSDGSSDESSGNIRLGAVRFPKRMRGHPSRTGGGLKRPVLPPKISSTVSSTANAPPARATTAAAGRPNKYNIWTESLQEDTLMETMRGCDVTANGMRNRDVESYDYKLRDRLQSGNAFERLKRRQSNSDDSDGYAGGGKRMRTSHSSYPELAENRERRGSVKDRIGKRNTSTDSNSDDCAQNAPRFDFRHIPDLNVEENCTNEQFGIELAGKLNETHTDLMVRVVEALGKDIPLKLFKETQKIEADGGMLVMKGWRRRTPGGVFLFLLKHCEQVDQEIKKTIFQEDKKAKQKEWKLTKNLNRDKKVEELKKTLNRQAANDAEQPSLPIMSHLKAETHSTLSNPPPSPVGEENFEAGSDYEARHIHVNVTTSPDKPLLHPNETDKDSDACPEDTCRLLLPDGPTPMRSLASYQEDCLDITCDDMDLF
ncbi:phosphorylated adapter RNA export protein isoform X1 [Anopheles stephensi]|uniref:phosphorylated adapter RNA export protein isoform X1 n=1 Tax=Anopheles stephensi TaxID=30069 RepID=UPI001658746F|nr:phosphorylated adapter RNA export protein isoform X1 [Anopheles stephensi]